MDGGIAPCTRGRDGGRRAASRDVRRPRDDGAPKGLNFPGRRRFLKLAISGKGGVGKSTVSAGLALLLARRGERVLAVDADPDANLAAALGIPESLRRQIVPISQRKALVEERTGAKVNQYGQMFKLNPEVSDIAETCGCPHEGVDLLVLGAVAEGGGGCACPESVLLRALVSDLVLHKREALILDMEAGVEHLGRATARGVDTMLVVVEPGRRSLDTALRVREMAGAIGVGDVCAVANKVFGEEDEAFLREGLGEVELIGSIPFSRDLLAADRDGRHVLDCGDADVSAAVERLLDRLTARTPTSS